MKALLRIDRSHQIFVHGRDFSKAKAAPGTAYKDVSSSSMLVYLRADVKDHRSIEQALRAVMNEVSTIDDLNNNAGASLGSQIARGLMTTRQAWTISWDINITVSQTMTETSASLLLSLLTLDLFRLQAASPHLALNCTDSNDSGYMDGGGFPKQTSIITGHRSLKTELNMIMIE